MNEVKKVAINELLDAWIGIMQGVVQQGMKFSLGTWAEHNLRKCGLPHDIDSLHSCGTAACGAGYLAASNFWKQIGEPASGESLDGVEAIMNHLDYPESKAYHHYDSLNALVFGHDRVYGSKGCDQHEDLNHCEVQAQDFLDALIRYRETGSPEIRQEVD